MIVRGGYEHMGGAGTLTPQNVYGLSSPRTTNPSRYYELARIAEQLAELAEVSWHELGNNGKQLLTILAYSSVEGPRTLPDRWEAFKSRSSQSLAILKGEGDAVGAYLSAYTRLINAVLAAVEREQLTYQDTLDDLLDTFDPNSGVNVDKDSVHDFLKDLSAKALR